MNNNLTLMELPTCQTLSSLSSPQSHEMGTHPLLQKRKLRQGRLNISQGDFPHQPVFILRVPRVNQLNRKPQNSGKSKRHSSLPWDAIPSAGCWETGLILGGRDEPTLQV